MLLEKIKCFVQSHPKLKCVLLIVRRVLQIVFVLLGIVLLISIITHCIMGDDDVDVIDTNYECNVDPFFSDNIKSLVPIDVQGIYYLNSFTLSKIKVSQKFDISFEANGVRYNELQLNVSNSGYVTMSYNIVSPLNSYSLPVMSGITWNNSLNSIVKVYKGLDSQVFDEFIVGHSILQDINSLGVWIFKNDISRTAVDIDEYFNLVYICDSYIGNEIGIRSDSSGVVLEINGDRRYNVAGWRDQKYRAINVLAFTGSGEDNRFILGFLRENATYQMPSQIVNPGDTQEPVVSFDSLVPTSASSTFASIKDNRFTVTPSSSAYNTAEWLYNLNSSMGNVSGHIQQYAPRGWFIGTNNLNNPVNGQAPWDYESTTFITYSATPIVSNELFVEHGAQNSPFGTCFLTFNFTTYFNDTQYVTVPLYLQLTKSNLDYVFRFYLAYENGNDTPFLNVNYLSNCYINNSIPFDFENVINFAANPNFAFPSTANLSVSPAALIATAYKSVFVSRLAGDNYSSGYAAGYAQGVRDSVDVSDSLMGMRYVYNVTEEFLSTKFFGEFSIGGLLAAFLGAACLIWLLKLFAGG